MKKWCMIAAGAILFLLVLLILLGFASKADKPERICEPYIVQSGETLWGIAERYSRGDRREWIYEVRQINGMKGSDIYAGEVIYVFEEVE